MTFEAPTHGAYTDISNPVSNAAEDEVSTLVPRLNTPVTQAKAHRLGWKANNNINDTKTPAVNLPSSKTSDGPSTEVMPVNGQVTSTLSDRRLQIASVDQQVDSTDRAIGEPWRNYGLIPAPTKGETVLRAPRIVPDKKTAARVPKRSQTNCSPTSLHRSLANPNYRAQLSVTNKQTSGYYSARGVPGSPFHPVLSKESQRQAYDKPVPPTNSKNDVGSGRLRSGYLSWRPCGGGFQA